MSAPAPVLLAVEGVEVSYPARDAAGRPARLQAVRGVDLEVRAGTCLGLVGESGSGKSTLGLAMLHLLAPDAGCVRFDGRDLGTLGRRELRRLRRQMQMVFQAAGEALDPLWRVGDLVVEPLVAHGLVGGRAERRRRAAELLAAVDLPASMAGRRPHQLSGGQRQRVGIARAVATEPRLLVLDEPTSALDVSVQARILALLEDLRRRMGLTMVFISHDLAVIEQVADEVAVTYLGRVVERAPRASLFAAPRHPYTAALMAAVPRADPAARRRHRPPPGEVPSPLAPPPGCPFHPRCPSARERCRRERPALAPRRGGGEVACFYPGEADAGVE